MKTKSPTTPSRKARPGNRNAAKPPAEKRVALSVRVAPETLIMIDKLTGRDPGRRRGIVIDQAVADLWRSVEKIISQR